MSKSKRWPVFAILIVLIASIGIVLFINTQPDQPTGKEDTPTTDKSLSLEKQLNDLESSQTQSTTIAGEWQWQELEDQKSQNDSQEQRNYPFTPQSVHDALQEVKVDENGDVILDHHALLSLDEALERIHNLLDGESLLELQNIIEAALPGKVGEQTAQLVENYKGFLDAKEQFSEMHRDSATNSNPTVATITKDQALYTELQDLREIHLGSDVAEKLFQVSDANAEFMFESMKLDLDQSLSADEIEKRRSELEKRHRDIVGSN